jgi:CHAD domain-containing protein
VTFALDPRLPVGQELRRVVVEALDDALAALAATRGADPEAVEEHLHDVRRRCKEVRGAARLVRRPLGARYRAFNRLVGDGARELAELRDAQALSSASAGLAKAAPEQFTAVRAELADLATRANAAVAAGDPRVDRARQLLGEARTEALTWDLGDGFDVIEQGLRRTYREARRAWRASRSDPGDEQLHTWRRDSKYLWHQLRLLEPADADRLAPLLRRLDRIGDSLGDDHDLVLLIDRIESDPRRFAGPQVADAVIRLARKRRRRLRKRAVNTGAKVFGRRPPRFTRRVRRAWEAAAVEA